MRTPVFSLIILVASLSGCALSPQVIELSPRPAVTQQNVGNNAAVQIRAADQRGDDAFGTRGGIYGKTSLIRPAGEIGPVLLDATRKGLQAQGFNAYNPATDAVALDVNLKQLSYVPEAGSVVNSVEVKALIEATARNAAGDEYIGRYMAGNNYEQPITPSAKRNQEMLNEVLERALAKMLSDPKLLTFLSSQP